MRPSRLILGFLLRFIIIFALLVIPWPNWNDLYGAGFRAVGNAIFGCDDENCLITFKAYRQMQGFSATDSQITLANPRQLNSQGQVPANLLGLDTRSVGWMPTALTIALIVATPIPWRRRCWSMAGGLILIHLFILFSVMIYIWNESTVVSLVTMPPWLQWITSNLEYTLLTQMGASFSVPVLIWIIVTFRKQDAALFAKILSPK